MRVPAASRLAHRPIRRPGPDVYNSVMYPVGLLRCHGACCPALAPGRAPSPAPARRHPSRQPPRTARLAQSGAGRKRPVFLPTFGHLGGARMCLQCATACVCSIGKCRCVIVNLDPMTPHIRFRADQLADLSAIRALGVRTLQAAILTLQAFTTAPVRPEELEAKLRATLGAENQAVAESLVRQLLSLQGLRRRMHLTSEDIFAGLMEGLRPENSQWTDKQYQEWLEVCPLVQQLFNFEVVSLSAKALDLAYEHQELLKRATILTDTRPVFNDDASDIRGMVVSHSLLLSYDDAEGDHVLSLALDNDDITYLKYECERALKKAATAKAQLQKRAGITTIIPGAEENEQT